MYESIQKRLIKELDEVKISGRFKSERVIESTQKSEISVNNNKVLNFCANNYLGLASNKKVIARAKETLDSHGFGMASVRFICGTQDIHKQLENKISEFLDKEDTILYAAAFDANGGLFEPLFNDQDAIISDELNHASIIDGIRLCKAKRFRYKHNDMKDLEEQLINSKDLRNRIIVTDGVFSMDGTIAQLLELLNEDDSHLKKLKDNTKYFRDKILNLGFEIKPGSHPIVPVMLYDDHLAQKMSAELLKLGIYVIGFFFPVVPKGQARIRVQISAAHSKEDIDKALNSFYKVGKELGVI